jgi:hypothetical protein
VLGRVIRGRSAGSAQGKVARENRMYKIEKAQSRLGGRAMVVVSQTTNGRRVCGASMEFVRWMYERVPLKQLREEQRALVKWYKKEVVEGPPLLGAVPVEPRSTHVETSLHHGIMSAD